MSSIALAARWKPTPASSNSSRIACSAGPTPAAQSTSSSTKRSVGVGGHISSIDAEVGPTHDVYREGMRRELDEEVIIDTPYTETVAGLINDDETPVGQVHLGMVHLCDVAEPNVQPREADIQGARFTPVADILTRLDDFESWSQIAIRALFG